MGIFGTAHTATDLPVFENYTVENNGHELALQEASQDYFEINNSIHALEMKELSVMESAGYDDEVVLEKLGGNVLAKIKKFFVDFAAKIRAWFGSLVAAVDALFRNGESFIKKYEGVLAKRDTKGLKVKLLKYVNMEVDKIAKADRAVADELVSLIADASKAASAHSEQAAKEAKEKTEQVRENREEFLAEHRGKVVGLGKLSKKEYREALYTHFRGTQKPGHDIPEVEFDLAQVTANLKDSKAGKEIKKAADAFKKSSDDLVKKVNEAIKSIEKAQSSAKDGAKVKVGETEHDSSAVSAALDALRAAASTEKSQKAITLEAVSALRSAVSERTAASKKACLKALAYKPGKD